MTATRRQRILGLTLVGLLPLAGCGGATEHYLSFSVIEGPTVTLSTSTGQTVRVPCGARVKVTEPSQPDQNWHVMGTSDLGPVFGLDLMTGGEAPAPHVTETGDAENTVVIAYAVDAPAATGFTSIGGRRASCK